jgi:hypothetical protein
MSTFDAAFWQSDEWKQLQIEALRLHPSCEVCGSMADLAVRIGNMNFRRREAGLPLDAHFCRVICNSCLRERQAATLTRGRE